ncbi:acyl carrier protein [Micromonospora sp. NPDC049240]|uniref:acyl carrier protein n=1 Tax=Micromonospora sp. NPDC049240 TaxID=3155151 RepID=UPI0033F14E58
MTVQAQPGPGRLVELLHGLGVAHVTAADDLLALGLSSLKILQFSMAIEGEFGISVELSTLLAAPTLGALEEQLTAARPDGT